MRFIAIFGLYQYWNVSRDPAAEQAILDAIYTIKVNFNGFRVPGEASWYGLRVQDNPRAQSEKYHKIITHQISVLAKITLDQDLQDMSRTLYMDSH